MGTEWTHVRVRRETHNMLVKIRETWAALENQGRVMVHPGRWDEVTLDSIIARLCLTVHHHRQRARKAKAKRRQERHRQDAQDAGYRP